VRGNDYVYTLPITQRSVRGIEIVNNRAALPDGLPYEPLAWNAITMYVDPAIHRTATLYGNDVAMTAVRARESATTPAYPQGAVLALVTWAQRDDPHWFGGRIPDAPISIEFVQVDASAKPSSYRRYTGEGQAVGLLQASEAAQRTKFVLGLAPARLP